LIQKSSSNHRLNFVQANIKNINARRLSKMSSPRVETFVNGLRGSTEETSAYEMMRSAYSNRGAKKPNSRNNRSNSAQGDQVKALKKTITPELGVKKKEIMKLTIMNPSFRNETIIYNRRLTPEKKHEVMSE
jgi:hypothetical protein